MRNLKIALMGVVAFIVGCATVENQTRINSSLRVNEFNSVASSYYERPTFVSVNTMSSGEKTLLVEVDTYGSNIYGVKNWINFGEVNSIDYISMIDKYLEWESLAVTRGDQFEKKIGDIPDGSKMLELTFRFFSGNAANHYLVVSNCDLFCVENSSHQYYDRSNALKLRELLTQLKDKQLEATDIDGIYN